MTEVIITPTETGDTQAHIDAMVAKAEGRELPKADEAAERPAWLPEGFNTPEELAAAYAATQAKPEGDTEEAAKVAEQAAADVVTKAGLTMEALADQIATNGDIDEAAYAALAAQGVSKEMVASYVAGQQAIGVAMTQRLQAHVGGEEAFNALIAWAADGGITAAEAKAFNAVVDTGSEDTIKLALEGLRAKQNAAGGKPPTLLGGNRTANAAGDVYSSLAQMMADMRDPRYSSDPAFRDTVEKKLSRSTIM